MGKNKCNCGGIMCGPRLLREEYLPAVAPGQWRDKGEELNMPMEHATYIAKPNYIAHTYFTPSTAPRHDDPLSRHRLSYLNGAGAAVRPRRRSTSPAREIPSFSPQPIALLKRCGSGVSRPRPITASSVGVVRQSGRPKGWGRNLFPV